MYTSKGKAFGLFLFYFVNETSLPTHIRYTLYISIHSFFFRTSKFTINMAVIRTIEIIQLPTIFHSSLNDVKLNTSCGPNNKMGTAMTSQCFSQIAPTTNINAQIIAMTMFIFGDATYNGSIKNELESATAKNKSMTNVTTKNDAKKLFFPVHSFFAMFRNNAQ